MPILTDNKKINSNIKRSNSDPKLSTINFKIPKTPKTADTPKPIPPNHVIKGYATADDIGKRETMEDSSLFLLGSDFSIFGVFDGHGGNACSSFLANNFIKYFKKFLIETKTVQLAFVKTFTYIDESVLTSDIIGQSGSTGVVCFIYRLPDPLNDLNRIKYLYCAHVGDSRAVICRGGIAHRLTSLSDHKASHPVEVARISSSSGFVSNGRANGILAVSRAFGNILLKKMNEKGHVVSAVPDVSRTTIGPEDIFIIVACDGLWDVMSDQDAVNIAIKTMSKIHEKISMGDGKSSISINLSARIISSVLVEEALRLGSTDNITVVVVFL